MSRTGRLAVLASVAASLQLSPTGAGGAEDAKPLYARLDEAIAFVQGDDDASIRVMLPNGTRARGVVRPAFGTDAPALSPDGRQLAYVTSAPGPTLYVLDMKSRRTVLVAAVNSGGALYPAWSPDGRWIAFVRGRDIAVVHPDGSGLRRVTRAPFQDYFPTWSPDGRSIAFMRDRATFDSDIYRVPTAGGAVRRLTGGGVANSSPAWSPCGGTIAYVKEPTTGGHAQIWLMSPDGSNQRHPVEETISADDPAWSPDCAWIAFTRGRGFGDVGDGAEIYAMRPDGSDYKRITRNQKPDSEPSWAAVAG